jgi:hypothetical protein
MGIIYALILVTLIISCTHTPTKKDNPLGGKLELKILCIDQKGQLIECPEQTEEEMKCHDEDMTNPKKEL